MLARDRLARLIRSAPSRFQGRGYGGGGSTSGAASAGLRGDGYGPGSGNADTGSVLGQAEQQGSATGNGFAANASDSRPEAGTGSGDWGGEASGNRAGAAQIGALQGDGAEGSNVGENAGESGVGGSEWGESGGANGGSGEQYAEASGRAGGGGSSSSQAASAASGEPSGSNGGSAGGAAGSSRARVVGANGQGSSIADAKGRNWAVKKGGPGAVPIRRPIQVVVRENQLAMLPSRHALAGEAATGKVISLDQPMARISDEFVAALRDRVNGWGLAGSGLYWRPVLKLNVGPGAEQTATQIMRLLKDSGVEVSLPETARASEGATNNATR